jgi:hypothetical protein
MCTDECVIDVVSENMMPAINATCVESSLFFRELVGQDQMLSKPTSSELHEWVPTSISVDLQMIDKGSSRE